MKKIIVLLLTVAILLCFASCSSGETTEKEKTSTNSATTTTEIVDENLLTVEITVPASMFDEDNQQSNELSEEQKEQGFKSAQVNEDGSVTYTMSKAAFKDYKENLKATVEDTFNNLGSEYSFIQKVDYDNNFSVVKLYVDEATYSQGFNFMCVMAVGYSANMYQAYTNEEISCTVEVYNNANGELIESATYPQ